jgi:hypothetical protein
MARTFVMTFGVAIFTLIGAGVWAQVIRGDRLTTLTTAPERQVACSLDQKGDFSPGWMESSQDAHYRCMPTFDAALRPSGAAWVKVEADGSIGRQLPK